MDISIGRTLLRLLRGDITRQDTEAIVNAANSSLMGGGGVDGAIHRAGGPQILDECKEIVARQGRLPVGEAVITTGGRLKAKYIIHTVGPIWRGGQYGEPELLSNSYFNCLSLARDKGITSLSFPSISTGAYRFPIESAARIALKAVRDFLQDYQKFNEIRFILFDEPALLVYEKAWKEVSANKS
jgi:O-acetyl-ADP-ribose deacetylase (regulator of RNase III)